MTPKSILFWQPRHDYLKLILSHPSGQRLLVFLNYLIWPFLFYICYLLVRSSANFFWQILTATLIGEFIERYLKNKFFWKRPLYIRKDSTPPGLVKKWYETGSFPSGHTTKAIYFFLLISATRVFRPIIYLLFVLPLLFFRVFVGFHYPIDMFGGLFIGGVLWLSTQMLQFPAPMVDFIRLVFNFVFFIK